MGKKILYLGTGSPRDPGFEGVKIDGIPYKDYMEERGITVFDKLVMSCHGCPDLMNYYAHQMQGLAESGNRVVCGLQGGLLFGLPSIFATQTTFPIISFPTDDVSYTAIMVPPGHAAIIGVGYERKNQQEQREKGLKLAERILNLESDRIDIVDDFSDGKLAFELEKYKLNFGVGNGAGLKLAYNNRDFYPTPSGLLLRADSDANVNDWDYLNRAESRHSMDGFTNIPTGQVHRLDNLAIMALKVISLQRPELIGRINKIAREKRASYDERNLMMEFAQRFEVDPTK